MISFGKTDLASPFPTPSLPSCKYCYFLFPTYFHPELSSFGFQRTSGGNQGWTTVGLFFAVFISSVLTMRNIFLCCQFRGNREQASFGKETTALWTMQPSPTKSAFPGMSVTHSAVNWQALKLKLKLWHPTWVLSYSPTRPRGRKLRVLLHLGHQVKYRGIVSCWFDCRKILFFNRRGGYLPTASPKNHAKDKGSYSVRFPSPLSNTCATWHSHGYGTATSV